MFIYAYKQGSASARGLSKALGIKRIKDVGSRFKGGPRKAVINWGASEVPVEVLKCPIYNDPKAVKIASNKLEAFRHLMGHNNAIPAWTEDKEQAAKWLESEKYKMVVCRKVLNGHSGAGIVLAKTPQELVDCPLYVAYIPKKDEYRVHVGMGGHSVIDVQRKALNPDVAKEDANFQVRNHDNGFIYVRGDVNPPEKVLTFAKECVSILDLNFGAVDVIYNQKHDKAYVLEVNTAPGLTGTTLENYVNYFRSLDGNH